MQVEQLRRIELPDRRAVGTLDVVGENLELRLGVDRRVVGEEQYLVRLLGVGLLGVFADKNLAVEDAVRSAIEDTLVEFMARAIRLGVIDDGEVIEVLLAVREVEAVDSRFSVLAVEADADLVAHQGAAEREVVRRKVALGRLHDLCIGDVIRGSAFLLHLHVIDDGAFRERDLGDGVGEVDAFAEIALDDGRLGVFADGDQRARMRDRRLAAGVREVDDLDRLLKNFAIGHDDIGAIREKARVQGGESAVLVHSDLPKCG